MTPQRLQPILQQGEGITVEFKTARSELSRNVFESICAFLNRLGGSLVLGVQDDGTPVGVDANRVDKLKSDLITQSANPQKLSPPFTLFPEVVVYEGKTLIYLYVPQSSQVHATRGVVYDRSEDGDLKITDQERLSQLYLRKKGFYTESKVYPYLRFDDFRSELFPKIRNLVRSNRPDHPWLNLGDEDLLRSAGLWRRDRQEGTEGYTLAAALLLGDETTIRDVLPHYKTDALLRRENLDRYDDRDDIRVNLIEAYERLSQFVQKHLPDPFYLEGDQRISLRDKIFREVIANLLVHREYTSAYPAQMIIEPERVVTKNANRAVSHGLIDPQHFSPHPKNPVMLNFFKQLGRADELGSGIRNVTKYLPHYVPGKTAQFTEGDTFETIVPYPRRPYPTVDTARRPYPYSATVSPDGGISGGTNGGITERQLRIMQFIQQQQGAKTKDLQDTLGIAERTLERDVQSLREKNLVILQGSKKTGKYQLTEQGKQLLS